MVTPHPSHVDVVSARRSICTSPINTWRRGPLACRGGGCSAFGEQWGLVEPYICPSCVKVISAEERHLPGSEAATKDYPKKHYGQKMQSVPKCCPLSIGTSSWQQGMWHAFLRSAVYMSFFTVSMNMRTEEHATRLCKWMKEELKVAATPVFN